jgi:AsmA protein
MKKKHWLRIAGIVIGVIVLVLVVLPFMINVDSFRPKIETEASAALGRKITLGKLSLSILTSSVRADDIAIADDPNFSTFPFVRAESLRAGVELKPLIFSKKINVTEIVLEKPQITLIRGAGGTWNFSSLGPASGNKPDSPKTSRGTPAFSVAKLDVNDGKLMVANARSSAQPRVYEDVNIEVTNFSETSQFPFKLTAKLPAGGDADISGKAGPINLQNTAKTPFDAAVKVNNMNIAASGFIDRASGIGGLANFDGTLISDGSTAKAVGTFAGDSLKLSPKGSPATRRVTIKHVVDVDLDKQTAAITLGDIAIGEAQAHLTGTAQMQGDTQVVHLKLNAPGMPVEDLEAMLPALGIVLPSGSQLSGGKVSANLDISGPLSNLLIVGPVRLQDTTLKNFDLGSKLGALSTFAGKAVSKPDTSIRNFSLDSRVTPQVTQANNINLDVPAIGVITGAGTVTQPAGALNFRMKANLSGGMVGGITKVAGLSSGATSGIPFAIQGTTANPKFIPDVGGMVGNAATSAVQSAIQGKVPGGLPSSATDALGGLLGAPKKPKQH